MVRNESLAETPFELMKVRPTQQKWKTLEIKMAYDESSPEPHFELMKVRPTSLHYMKCKTEPCIYVGNVLIETRGYAG